MLLTGIFTNFPFIYSERMQAIIKKKLNQQNGSVASSSSSITSNSNNVTRRMDPTGAPEQRQSQRPPVQQNVPQPVRRLQTDPIETRSFVYDIVIAIIIGVIAMLLYRRFAITMDIPPERNLPPAE